MLSEPCGARDETCLGAGGLPPGKCVLMPLSTEPYEHAETFNTWWYELSDFGNGGNWQDDARYRTPRPCAHLRPKNVDPAFRRRRMHFA